LSAFLLERENRRILKISGSVSGRHDTAEKRRLHNRLRYTIKIGAIIGDAPARQFVKVTKGHNGYGGCERLTQKEMHITMHKCMVPS
jgi:hypothetical protein